jgi:hypothetical protein
VLDVDKQIDALLGLGPGTEEDQPEWIPPKPSFSCTEHKRIVDSFFGEASCELEVEARRIQAINDLVIFCN